MATVIRHPTKHNAYRVLAKGATEYILKKWVGGGVVWCGVVWCDEVWCSVVGCGVVWCGVVWCGDVVL